MFFSFRLHPLDLKEIHQMNKKANPEQILSRLLEVGGFPEPYFKGTKQFYNRWKKNSYRGQSLKRICLNWINTVEFPRWKPC